jgi:hypothetical protein
MAQIDPKVSLNIISLQTAVLACENTTAAKQKWSRVLAVERNNLMTIKLNVNNNHRRSGDICLMSTNILPRSMKRTSTV